MSSRNVHPIRYARHEHDVAESITTQFKGPDGIPEVHTAGGYARLEAAAIEIAKAAAPAAAAADREVVPEEIGRWSVQVAATILDECAKLRSGSSPETRPFEP